MSVRTGNKLKGHRGRTLFGILHTAGGTKSGMATKRYKFKMAALGAGVHGTAIRRVATVNHLRDVFHFNISGMQSILNDFVVVFKNLLQNIHILIIERMEQKNNPPLKNEGQGS